MRVFNISGGQGVKPLGNTQLSIGAKIHISSIASTSLSIKTPSLDFWRAKKKAEGFEPSDPCRSINPMKAVLAKKLYHKMSQP